MPTITIDDPTSNATVARPFTARGTYTAIEDPIIDVTLKNSEGQTVASDSVAGSGGAWSARLDPGQALAGASLTAQIQGTTVSDTVTNLTVT